MRILAYGWYDKENIGDESYKLSFPSLFPDHEWTFTDTVNDEIVQDHDVVVLGGGNILDSKFVSKLKPFAGVRPIYAFSVGCMDERLQPGDLDFFEAIYVRDRWSQQNVEKLGVACEVVPDAAFYFQANKARGKDLMENWISPQIHWNVKRKLGVTINTHLAGCSQDALAQDVLRFQMFAMDTANVIDRLPGNGIFIPYMTKPPWDDRVANGWVASRCRTHTKNTVIYETLGVQDVLDLTSALDAAICTRFHASVFCTIAGVPFVDIHHHDKNLSFLDMIDRLGWAVPFWDFSREKTHALVKELLESDTAREDLQEVGRTMRELLMEKVNGIHFNKQSGLHHCGE
jgi:polysaccharide pyruvyl transferase WcaK-like protein